MVLRKLHFRKLFLQMISAAESKLCDLQQTPQKQLFDSVYGQGFGVIRRIAAMTLNVSFLQKFSFIL
jgi:hypothetical protein